MDQRIRKLMMMHKALHLKDDIDRLYVSRKEKEGRLTSIEDCIDTSMWELKDYVKKRAKKTNISDQKQHWQSKDKQNSNN